MNTVAFPKLGLEFTFNRIAFSIGNVHIAWYGILIALGMIGALWYGYSQSKKFGIIGDKLMDAGLAGIVGGIIGARLYYVAFSWEEYKDNIWSIFYTWNGGLAIYGGLIGGLLLGVLVAKLRHINLKAALDIATMGFLIGQSIGRWGNFVNVEAFGSNTDLPWGMTSPVITSYLQRHAADLSALGVTIDPSAPVHPCFLYESLWCALGFVLLCIYRKHRRFDGEIFLMYSFWYGLGRFFIEGLRTDSLLLGQIRVSQLLAGFICLASLIVWIVVRAKIHGSNDPEYLKPYAATQAFADELEAYALAEKEAEEKRKAKKAKKGLAEIFDDEEVTDEETTDEEATDEEAADEEVTAEEATDEENPEDSASPAEADASEEEAPEETEEREEE